MSDARAAALTGLGRSTTDVRSFSRFAGLCSAVLLLAACSNKATIDPRVGVAASPRVVEDDKPIPKGGGRVKTGPTYKIAGKTFEPEQNPEQYSKQGLASWYGSAFHGRLTANGEIFDKGALSAAHPTLPLPSYARVTNINNGKSIVVRVNDRGPFHGNRAMDVSQKAAEILDFKNRGMARVRIDYVGPASLKGSDDAKLLATYREEGHAPTTAVASLDGNPPQPPAAAAAGLRGVVSNPPAQAVPQQAALASVSTPKAQPATVASTTPVDIASRIDAGLGGMAGSTPLGQPRAASMVQPVLSGFAFDPTFTGLR